MIQREPALPEPRPHYSGSRKRGQRQAHGGPLPPRPQKDQTRQQETTGPGQITSTGHRRPRGLCCHNPESEADGQGRQRSRGTMRKA